MKEWRNGEKHQKSKRKKYIRRYYQKLKQMREISDSDRRRIDEHRRLLELCA